MAAFPAYIHTCCMRTQRISLPPRVAADPRADGSRCKPCRDSCDTYTSGNQRAGREPPQVKTRLAKCRLNKGVERAAPNRKVKKASGRKPFPGSRELFCARESALRKSRSARAGRCLSATWTTRPFGGSTRDHRPGQSGTVADPRIEVNGEIALGTSTPGDSASVDSTAAACFPLLVRH